MSKKQSYEPLSEHDLTLREKPPDALSALVEILEEEERSAQQQEDRCESFDDKR